MWSASFVPTGGHSTNYVDNAVALEYVVQNAKGIDTDLHPITVNTSFEYQKLSCRGDDFDRRRLDDDAAPAWESPT